MGNFKVGDKVEVVSNFKGSINQVGDVGVIVKIDGDSLSVKVEGRESNANWHTSEELRLAETIKPSKKQRIETLEKEVSELKLIVHELRECKPSVFATTVGQDLEAEYAEQVKDEPSTDISVEDKQVDVIEFEGQQYRKVGREAVEGDVVILRATTSSYVENNKPYKVNRNVGITDKDGDNVHLYNKGVNRTTENVDVYELSQSPTTTEDIQPVQHQTVPCSAQTDKTPNELRAEVIEKAKAFFETNNGNEFVFSVDEDKRTAFCWKLVSNGCGYNTIHGLSTCHPNDVFNEHISKAIALGRALKLDVSEFEQAVQPSEFAVGQAVTYTNDIAGRYKNSVDQIKSFEDDTIWYENGDGYSLSDDDDDFGIKIINDTNAIYSEVK